MRGILKSWATFSSAAKLFAILFVGSCFAQTLPTPLQISRVYGVTSATQFFDNRSSTRQCNYYSFNVTASSGNWSVQLEYADGSSTGTWTPFGTSAIVSAVSGPTIGFGNGYHDFVRLNTTSGGTTSILSCEKDFFIPSASGSGGGVQFPILIGQGGTGSTTATGATQNLQYQGPQPGTAARSVQSKLSDVVSILDFAGCDPTGTSDSTVCLQAALNVSSGYTNNTSLNLYVPPGVYLISSTLTYYGNQSKSLIFSGAGFGPGASVIRWTGAANGTMLSLTGMSGSKIEGLDFDGNSLALIGIENNAENNSGQPISTNDIFSGLSFEGFTGSNVDLAFGNKAADCPSEALHSMTVRDSVFAGTGGTAIGIQCGGGVADFRIERNQMSGFATTISSATSSGTYVKLDADEFTGSTVADIAFTTGTLSVVGGASSGAPVFLTLGAPGSTVPTSAAVQGFAWTGCQSGCSGDVVVTNYGALTLNANEFRNLRTPTSLPLIQTVNGGRTDAGNNNTGSSVLSTNNFYLNASNLAGGSPFEDTAGFCLVDTTGACSAGSAYRVSNFPLAFSSLGDRGGTGAAEIALTAQRPTGGFQSFTQLRSATTPGFSAQSGAIGLAATDVIAQRNAANNADINVASKNSLDQVVLGDTRGVAFQGPLALALTAGAGGVTANTLVAYDASAGIVPLSGGGIPLGIAAATASQGATVPISVYGVATCISDNTATVGHIAIGGTVTAERCSDSGQTTQSGIPSTTPLVGIILTNAAGAGQSISVQLFGPGESGTQSGGSGSSAFNSLTSGTNTQAAMLVGTGASLGPTGSGTVNANQINGLSPATSATTDTTSATNISSGTLNSGRLPAFTGDTTTAAGSSVTTTGRVNGTTVPTNSTADQTILTTGSAIGSWASIPLCLDSAGQHLNYNTSTHAFACGTSGGTAGSAAFNTITNGTNTQAAMVVDTGASLAPAGSGTISANKINGLTPAASATTDATVATNITSGTLPAAQLPTFTGDTTTSPGSAVTTTAKVNGTTVPVNSAADQFLGTTASATGAWAAVPGCLDTGGNHLNYNTSTHAFACGTSGGTAGSAAFNTISSGTNASAAMVLGTGSSLTVSGAGTNNANLISGLTPAASATTDTTVATNISSGTLGAARLPAFTGDTTTSAGSAVTTTGKVNGTTVPINSAADQTIVTTASATGSWAAIPLCLDSAGQHLNYNTSTHAFACGTSGGSSGVTNLGTTGPITGGPITGTGTIACPTCTTAAAPLTSGRLLSGAAGQAIQLADLSGDATTSGSTAVTVLKIHGTTVPVNSAADQALITNASATGLWATLPNCLDSAGNHLNYNTTTHAISCGTTTSGTGLVSSVSGTSPIASSGGTTPAISCPTCGTASGTLTSGQLVIGAGSKALQTGNLAGDVTTSGTTTAIVAAINGTTVPVNAATDQVLLTTGIGAGTWTSVSACLDSTGNHLNYNSSTHSFLCGTSGPAAVTSIATTGPITGGTITATGTIACPTCNTSAGALTSGQILTGGGSQAIVTGDLTGDVTTSGSTATTAARIHGTTVPTNSAADQALITSASATGVWSAIPLCVDSLGQHLNYNTATHLFSCGSTAAASANAFNTLTDGTNTQAAMLVGTGASLGPTGAGTVNANQISGLSPAASATTDTTVASNISSGTLSASRLPAFTGDTTTSAGSAVTTTAKVNGTTVPVNSAADEFLGTTASATGAWAAVPVCLDSGGNHLNYNTSTHAFSCGTSGGTAGSAAFNTISSGTNASAAMVLGTGSSLTVSGSGTNNANLISGLSPAASATTDTTVATNISSGTLGAARLPAFTGDTTTSAGSAVTTTAKVNGTTVPTNAAADQTVVTTASATGSWASLPICLDAAGQHLNYNTSTHAFSCGTSGGTAGSAAFNTITTGSNTQAAMTVGTGASLAPTGSGTINANLISGLAPAASATTDTTSATNISSGTLGAARLPAFTGDTTTSAGSSVTTTAKVNGTTVPTNSAANQFLGTTASAVGAWTAMPLCLDSVGQHLNFNTTTHAFSCGTSQGAGTAAFSALTGGTNTSAAMLVGTGASLAPTGSGTVTANQVTLTGDVTTSAGLATTLATVNSGPGACGDATHVCAITTNGKGLVTAQTATSIGGGTVTSIATTGPITGGTITSTGTIACATCNTSAGSLASGQILVGAGGQAIQTGNLSGDVTTAGGTVATVPKINGTTVPTNSAADQTLVTTASATGAWTSFPGCLDSGGNHLNYNTSTHLFSCGTSGGAPAFSGITSGTNTTAAMILGSGGTLLTAGTGVISANQLNNTSLAGLATGLLKNTTATGIPSIAVAGTDYEVPITASSPIIRSANNFNCPTCATTTNGGALSATAPVTVSAAGVIACANCATAAGTLTSTQLLTGGGSKALQSADLTGDVTTTGTTATTDLKVHGTTVPVNTVADQFLGTTSPAVGAWSSMPNCLDSAGQHLNYNTATHVFTCGTTGGGSGSSAFSALTSGTNTTAAMVVGTGASLGTTGTGTVQATSLNGFGPFSLVGGLGTAPSLAAGQMGLWFDSTNIVLNGRDTSNNTTSMVRTLTNGVSTACGAGSLMTGVNANGVPTCATVATGGPSVQSGTAAPTNSAPTCNSGTGNAIYIQAAPVAVSSNAIPGGVWVCQNTAASSNGGFSWARQNGHQVNVMNYGCKGNGSTDDSACFQNAVNVAKVLNNYPSYDSSFPVLGSDVYIPCGNYALGQPIILPRTQVGDFSNGATNGVVGLIGESSSCTNLMGIAGSGFFGVTGVMVTNPGTGYTSAPTVTLSGGCTVNPGVAALLQPSTTNVANVYLTSASSGCTSTQPTCSISGGGGSGATCLTLGRALIEWADIATGYQRTNGERIMNLQFKPPAVTGSMAIHFTMGTNTTPNDPACTLGGGTVCDRMSNSTFENLSAITDNFFSPAFIYMGADCNTCIVRNINNDAAHQVGAVYQSVTIASNFWVFFPGGEGEGFQYGQIDTIACGGAKGGTAPCFQGRLQRQTLKNAFCDGIRSPVGNMTCFAFYNSQNVILENIGNEGESGLQILLQNSDHFQGTTIGIGSPVAGNGTPVIGGMSLVHSSNNIFSGHTAGQSYADNFPGTFTVSLDSTSFQNEFLNWSFVGTNDVSIANTASNYIQYCLKAACGTGVNWSHLGTNPF